mmetsp:Transcript_56851/g.77521  ORF Transcript_56851/g.77521 Transcript_56851/m.77521 type:complete len:82 (+) Transcript_56851:195-440(+)
MYISMRANLWLTWNPIERRVSSPDMNNPLRRPGDVTFRKDQTLHAIDFETTRCFIQEVSCSRASITPHEELMAQKEDEKRR